MTRHPLTVALLLAFWVGVGLAVVVLIGAAS